MTEEYTLPLADPGATLENVGGKGASLARLASAGLPVPGGFHVTTIAYRQFVAGNRLQPAILEKVRAVDTAQPYTLETASAAIIEWAMLPLPPGEARTCQRARSRGEGSFAILQARPITALPPEPAAQLEWRLPKPKGRYARSSIIELMPEPLSPLFATLGVEEINRGYRRFAARLGAPGMILEPFVVLINDFAYYAIKFSARQLLAITVVTPRIAKFAFRSPDRRWEEEARPRYAECVARWKEEELATLPAHELLRGVREIFSTAIDHYIQALQAGILPAAYFSEAVFTWFYDKLVRKAGDPAALTFMLGFDSLPIRAEKSLYDLAQWCRERPALADLLSSTGSGRIAAWLGEAQPPTGIPTEDWHEFRARFAAHLERYGHAIYDLDFSKPVPADDPAPLIETLRHLILCQGSDPYRRQQEATRRREEATRRVEGRLRGGS